MKLTRTERWILANQYRILEAVDPENADHYKEAQTVLEDGYELHYDEISQEIYQDQNTLSESECREVIDILAMYSALQYSYKALPDKSGIAESRLTFPGLDGNNETKQMAYARFYCSRRPGYFADLDRSKDFNSHTPSLGRYKSMLVRWRANGGEHELTKEQIIDILGV